MRSTTAIFLLVILLAVFTPAQDLDSMRLSLSSGGLEAKRNTLFRITNLRTEPASRVAIAALSDRNDMIRATAAAAVIFIPKAEAVSVLTPLLTDKSRFVRTEAAYALGGVGHQSAVGSLSAMMQTDPAPEARAAAAAAMGQIGESSALEPLTSILKSKPVQNNEYLRRTAARSVGQIAYKIRSGGVTAGTDMMAAARTLVKVLNNSSESGDTRREAAAALGAIRDPASIGALQLNLGSSDPYLAETCDAALKAIRNMQ